MALALVLAACTGSAPSTSPSDEDQPSTTVPGSVIAQIDIPSTVRSGTIVGGQVVVENTTGSAVHEEGCGYFQVFLVTEGETLVPVWGACSMTMTIPVGTSRYPVKVVAAQDGCVQAALPPELPPCIPLPPGDYRAQLYQAGEFMDDLPSVQVRVT